MRRRLRSRGKRKASAPLSTRRSARCGRLDIRSIGARSCRPQDASSICRSIRGSVNGTGPMRPRCGGRPERKLDAVTAKPDDTSLEWLYQLRWKSVAPRRRLTSPTEAVGWSSSETRNQERRSRPRRAGRRWHGSVAARGTFDDAAASCASRRRSSSCSRVSARTRVPAAVRVASERACRHAHVRARLWFATRGAQAVLIAADWSGCPSRRRHSGGGEGRRRGAPGVLGRPRRPRSARRRADDASALVCARCVHRDNEDQVACAWRPAIRPAPHGRAGGASPRADSHGAPDAAYLITGGLGEVGLHVATARWRLTACGVSILIGRTPLPPREQWAALDPRHRWRRACRRRCARSRRRALRSTSRRSTSATKRSCGLPRALRRRGLAADSRRRSTRRASSTISSPAT